MTEEYYDVETKYFSKDQLCEEQIGDHIDSNVEEIRQLRVRKPLYAQASDRACNHAALTIRLSNPVLTYDSRYELAVIHPIST